MCGVQNAHCRWRIAGLVATVSSWDEADNARVLAKTIRFKLSIAALVDGLKERRYNLRDDSAMRWDQEAGFVTILPL